MVISAAAGVFAVENVIDLLVSRYVITPVELITWMLIAVISGVVVYHVGDERGDW